MSLQKQITYVASAVLLGMLSLTVYFSLISAESLFSERKINGVQSFNEIVKGDGYEKEEKNELSTFQINELNKQLKESRRAFKFRAIGSLAILSIVGIFAIHILVGRSTKPLVELQKKVDSLDSSMLGEEFCVKKFHPIEIRQLTVSFNKMNIRLKDAFIQQKLFLDNAAHELKTPLTAIGTYVQLLQMDGEKFTLEENKIIQTIRNNCDHLEETIGQLLLLQSNDEIDYSDDVNMNQVIIDVIDDLSDVAKERNIFVENKNTQNYQLKGNRTLLRLVIKNLLDNAIKYGDSDSHIEISMIKKEKNIQVSIKNWGDGINEKDYHNIFEPFYRSDDLNRKIKGSGLGLSLVKKIVEKHGGQIICTSRKKETVFTFSLLQK